MNTPPIIRRADGTAEWTQKPGDFYLVTGRDIEGRRNPPRLCATWREALGWNYYAGARWLVRNGRRYLIQRIGN